MENAEQKIIDSDNYCGRPVLGKIVVLPQSALEEFTCPYPWSCISITGTGSLDRVIDETNRVDIFRVQFDDIEFERPGTHLQQITEQQGDDIWDFVEKVWDKSALLMIHCAAGISRSTAVAKAISDAYQPEQASYFDQLYSPNMLVYKVLRKCR